MHVHKPNNHLQNIHWNFNKYVMVANARFNDDRFRVYPLCESIRARGLQTRHRFMHVPHIYKRSETGFAR